ncbi:MAG: hypothetical protein RL060_544 [Bacteroidota bacterium]
MNILADIIQSKYGEVAKRKALTTTADLEKSSLFERKVISLKQAIHLAKKTLESGKTLETFNKLLSI